MTKDAGWEMLSFFSKGISVYPIASTLVMTGPFSKSHFFQQIMLSFDAPQRSKSHSWAVFVAPKDALNANSIKMFEHIWTFFEPYLNAMRTQSLHQRICPRWSASFLPPARKKGVFFENGLLIIYQSWGYQVLGTNYIYIPIINTFPHYLIYYYIYNGIWMYMVYLGIPIPYPHYIFHILTHNIYMYIQYIYIHMFVLNII